MIRRLAVHMWKVVIVEDEILVRIGMKNSIDWSQFGMQVIADVANGQEAWDIYLQEKPDIILTDIKMPLMDGMELISKIRTSDSKTKIVILTVYEEFHYVHQSLHLGVSDYILKLNMTITEMEAVLKKIQKELISERKHVVDTLSVQDLTVDLTRKKEAIVKDFLFSSRYSEQEFSRILPQINFRLHSQRLLLCIASIDQYDQIEHRFQDHQGNLIRFSFLNILEEVLDSYKRGEIIHEKDDRYILLFSFYDLPSEREIYETLQHILMQLNQAIKKHLNTTLTFWVSSQQQGYQSLRKMYKECTEAMTDRFYLEKEQYMRCDQLKSDHSKYSVVAMLTVMLEQTNFYDEQYRTEIINGIKQLSEVVTRQDLLMLFTKWIHLPAVHSANAFNQDLTELSMQYAKRIRQIPSLDQVISCFQQYVATINQWMSSMKSLNKDVAKVVTYLQKHFREETTLQQLADYAHMTPNYLSSLFKQEMGLSVVEFINTLRMNYAKELLTDSHLKVYEVAQQVGIADESYFSRVFKRTCGLSPNEYRKQLIMTD